MARAMFVLLAPRRDTASLYSCQPQLHRPNKWYTWSLGTCPSKITREKSNHQELASSAIHLCFWYHLIYSCSMVCPHALHGKPNFVSWFNLIRMLATSGYVSAWSLHIIRGSIDNFQGDVMHHITWREHSHQFPSNVPKPPNQYWTYGPVVPAMVQAI